MNPKIIYSLAFGGGWVLSLLAIYYFEWIPVILSSMMFAIWLSGLAIMYLFPEYFPDYKIRGIKQ